MPADVHSLDHIYKEVSSLQEIKESVYKMGRTNSPMEQIFKWGSGGGGGGLMQMCKCEQTRGVWGYALPRKFQIQVF